MPKARRQQSTLRKAEQEIYFETRWMQASNHIMLGSGKRARKEMLVFQINMCL